MSHMSCASTTHAQIRMNSPCCTVKRLPARKHAATWPSHWTHMPPVPVRALPPLHAGSKHYVCTEKKKGDTQQRKGERVQLEKSSALICSCPGSLMSCTPLVVPPMCSRSHLLRALDFFRAAEHYRCVEDTSCCLQDS
jgi:hypothetical protein